LASPEVVMRKDRAGIKTRRAQRPKTIEYCVENDDILLLSGLYNGQYVRELFQKGPAERDYIVKNLWFQHDDEIIKIINSLTCR